MKLSEKDFDLPDVDEIRQWVEDTDPSLFDDDENVKAWWLDAKALLNEVDRLQGALEAAEVVAEAWKAILWDAIAAPASRSETL